MAQTKDYLHELIDKLPESSTGAAALPGIPRGKRTTRCFVRSGRRLSAMSRSQTRTGLRYQRVGRT